MRLYKTITPENDKRIFERIPAKMSLRLFNINSNKWGLVESEDISAKGIGITADESLKPRNPLEIWIPIPDKGEAIYTRGEVVWTKKIDPEKFRVGINLEKASLIGIIRLLRQYQAEKPQDAPFLS